MVLAAQNITFVCMKIHKRVTNAISSFKITIWFSIFAKIANYFTTTADQNKKPVAYNAL